jgi:hypothetical protein
MKYVTSFNGPHAGLRVENIRPRNMKLKMKTIPLVNKNQPIVMLSAGKLIFFSLF